MGSRWRVGRAQSKKQPPARHGGDDGRRVPEPFSRDKMRFVAALGYTAMAEKGNKVMQETTLVLGEHT